MQDWIRTRVPMLGKLSINQAAFPALGTWGMVLLLLLPSHVILVILYYRMCVLTCVVMHVHAYIPRVSVEVRDHLWGRFCPPSI